jgi:hypothetical protein
VAHTYNFSYLGGRDQEDHSLSPAWANTSWDPHLEITGAKWAKSRVPALQAQSPEFKSQSHQKNKNPFIFLLATIRNEILDYHLQYQTVKIFKDKSNNKHTKSTCWKL